VREVYHDLILEWYAQEGRKTLPWRQTKEVYAIYISEIMLQQTQVKTVLERFYLPFLGKFPTLESLSKSSLDEVLKLWEGLGYYSRAKNLHHTAQFTKGKLPSSAKALQELKGIGKSTAHAIACFAYDEPLPILDANVRRILYRFFAIKETKELWDWAYKLFDAQNAYEYNQAMMDIGTMVCTSKNPKCDECPLNIGCLGKETPLEYPMKKLKTTKPIRQKDILIYTDGKKYFLVQNSGRFLHGLWSFIQEEPTTLRTEDIFLGNIDQHYTHFKLEARVILRQTPTPPLPCRGFLEVEFKALAMSMADMKAIELLRRTIST